MTRWLVKDDQGMIQRIDKKVLALSDMGRVLCFVFLSIFQRCENMALLKVVKFGRAAENKDLAKLSFIYHLRRHGPHGCGSFHLKESYLRVVGKRVGHYHHDANRFKI